MQVISQFLERRPGVGIFASFSGFGVSLTSLIHTGTLVLGFGGAIFGLLAGYYTYRIQKHKWEREQQHRITPKK